MQLGFHLCREKEWSCLNEHDEDEDSIHSISSRRVKRVGGSQKGKDIGHNLSKLIDKSHRKEKKLFRLTILKTWEEHSNIEHATIATEQKKKRNDQRENLKNVYSQKTVGE